MWSRSISPGGPDNLLSRREAQEVRDMLVEISRAGDLGCMR